MSVSEELVKIADCLWVEAKHWQDHPDYFTPRRDVYEGTKQSYKEALDGIKSFMAERANMQRGTHTDIVLRDLSWQLKRLATELEPEDDGRDKECLCSPSYDCSFHGEDI